MSLAQNNGQPRRWERSRAYRDNSLNPKPELVPVSLCSVCLVLTVLLGPVRCHLSKACLIANHEYASM